MRLSFIVLYIVNKAGHSLPSYDNAIFLVTTFCLLQAWVITDTECCVTAGPTNDFSTASAPLQTVILCANPYPGLSERILFEPQIRSNFLSPSPPVCSSCVWKVTIWRNGLEHFPVHSLNIDVNVRIQILIDKSSLVARNMTFITKLPASSWFTWDGTTVLRDASSPTFVIQV